MCGKMKNEYNTYDLRSVFHRKINTPVCSKCENTKLNKSYFLTINKR